MKVAVLSANLGSFELNETFWKGDESHPYFEIYRQKLKLWQDFIKPYE